MNYQNSPHLDLFERFVQDVSLNRFKKYCQTELTIERDESFKEIQEGSYASEMCIIMIWGHPGALTFKIHFELETIKKICARNIGQSYEEISEKIAREYVRELCNLLAGYLRGFLENKNILMGMSLPFLALGQDENVFRKVRDPRSSFKIWKIKSEFGDIVCSTELIVLEDSVLKNLEEPIQAELKTFEASETTSSDDGEVNFF